ncbi:MAG TPA: CobD/CbiB family cobalamin biosynthesis protein [Acidimicrobiales bacterium]|nr:CobD/CbiB family cobalamin biosynthesis protein [Acidimicrobiales bacterium]
MRTQASSAAAGVLADALFGEPPLDPHPLRLFGQTMRAVERRAYADRRLAGCAYVAIGTAFGAVAGRAVGTGTATYLAVGGRGLHRAALDVADALAADDLEQARGLLPALVGRDPSALDSKEIARAAVESVAENTVDAIVAPALWAAVAGGAGALGYRAVNTLDALVGHRSPRYLRFGWASARLDDVANWAPARLTATLVAAARPRSAQEVWSVVRHQAPAHPSPNAGVAEGAFAAALDLRLGGENRYGDRVELRPYLGFGRPAEGTDIARAVRLSADVRSALLAVLALARLAS